MSEYKTTDYSELRRGPSFGSYDKQVVHAIIDEAAYCHVSAQVKGRPYIQATVHWREDDNLYVHGAMKNKMIHGLTKGVEAAVSFMHFDGYVLARSAFNHAVLYRSVTLFGKPRHVTDLDEKMRILGLFIERISPGRWNTVRQPTPEELKMTGVLEFAIEEVSAKLVRTEGALGVFPGGKGEVAADQEFTPWTGVYPYQLVQGEPVSSAEIQGRYK